jgi:histidinol phosphatase-like enzyme (inositol monophosphatase family)
MPEPSPRQLLEVAMDAAWIAGRRALAWFDAGVPVTAKPDGSPVTPADLASERALRERIHRAFPDHSVLGEEEGETRGTAPYRWLLDPIDGTRTFVQGVPLWGVLVGVERQGDAIAGACYLPALDEMLGAASGEGCTRNGRACRVSNGARLEDAILCPTSARAARRRAPGYDALAERIRTERTWGDCYGYALVASGRAEIALDSAAAAWDLCAMRPIVEEAGGLMTDWRGRRTHRGGDALATNGLLHAETLALLQARG